jgi:hypothetical protein
MGANEDEHESSQLPHVPAIIRLRRCRVNVLRFLRVEAFQKVIHPRLAKGSPLQGAYCRPDESLEQCFAQA